MKIKRLKKNKCEPPNLEGRCVGVGEATDFAGIHPNVVGAVNWVHVDGLGVMTVVCEFCGWVKVHKS